MKQVPILWVGVVISLLTARAIDYLGLLNHMDVLSAMLFGMLVGLFGTVVSTVGINWFFGRKLK